MDAWQNPRCPRRAERRGYRTEAHLCQAVHCRAPEKLNTKARGDAWLIREELMLINDQIGEHTDRQLAREARAARIRLEAAQDGRADAQARIDVATVIDGEKVRRGCYR